MLVMTEVFFHLLFPAWPKFSWISAYKVNICKGTTFTNMCEMSQVFIVSH